MITTKFSAKNSMTKLSRIQGICDCRLFLNRHTKGLFPETLLFRDEEGTHEDHFSSDNQGSKRFQNVRDWH
jgi:hypothetical protein